MLRRYLRRSAAVKNGHDFDLPAGRALSKREREVLGHLVRGRTNKQIAQRLGVTDHTVKTQVNRIYEKLEVRNRVDLFALAVEQGGSRMCVQATLEGSASSADHRHGGEAVVNSP
jgi:DNA-binding NarL/FixJ family response regulator